VVAEEAVAMISSRRGLELLVVVAVVLGVLLVLDLRRESPSTDRAVAHGIDVDAVTALAWSRPGRSELHLVRERERWVWVKPVEALADPTAVANVLATLRAARWHRREPAAAAGPTHTVLTISTAMPTSGGRPPEYADLPRRTLAIGAPLAGAEQAWIVDGEHALLVDAWVARALDPDPVTLMLRRPLDAVAQAAWLEVKDARGPVRLEGSPRRLVTPSVALVRPALIEPLQDALSALEIVAIPAGAAGPEEELVRIMTPAGTVTLTDRCGGGPHVLLTAPGGTGCVARTQYAAVLAALEPLRATGRDVVDPRPAPLDAATITLRDGAVLDVAKLRIGEHAADPVRVTELLAVLSAPAELAELPPGAKVVATLAVSDRHGATIALELLAGGLVRRPGEALGGRLTASAASVLARTARALRDLVPWLEDPLAVQAIKIDAVRTYARGATVGEWLPPGRASALDALAQQLASPRPLSAGPAAFATVHRVVIEIRPPAGSPVEHALELGRKTPAGCPARANDLSLLLPAAVCDGVAVLAR